MPPRHITPEQFQEHQQQWNQPVDDGDVEGQQKKLNAAFWVAYCLYREEGGADWHPPQAQQILEQAMTGMDSNIGKHVYLLASIYNSFIMNQERAKQLYRQAIPQLEMEVQQGGNDENYRQAAFYLGTVFFLGYGVDKDLHRGIHWWKKAAEPGHGDAEVRIERHCFREPFLAEIVSWLHQIADQNNNPWTQYQLGRCYEYGEGVKKDLVKAVEWYDKAIAQGYERATRSKQWLLDPLSPEECSKTLGCVVRNQKIEKAKSLIQQSFVGEAPLSLWPHTLAAFQNQGNPPWEAPSPTFLSLRDAIMPQLQKQSKNQKGMLKPWLL